MENKENIKTYQKKLSQVQPHQNPISRRDFRLYLQDEFLRRLQINPQYSLRAYAQFFEMNSGSLSQILKGKRKLGSKLITKMALKLNLSPEEIDKFIKYKNNLIQEKDPTQTKAFNNEQLTLDSFNIISDWYHFAILELPKLKGFQPDHQWIAKKLGLSVTEVNLAIERLKRVGLIEITNNNQWVLKSKNLSTLSSDFTTAALRKLQTQILEKAIDALNLIPIEDRNQTALTVGINKEDLETVKNMIHRFRREINAFVESNPKSDEVYHISFSLYPVSKKEIK